jgi:hypothetical protein
MGALKASIRKILKLETANGSGWNIPRRSRLYLTPLVTHVPPYAQPNLAQRADYNIAHKFVNNVDYVEVDSID